MPEVDLRPLRDGVRVEAWAGDDDPVVGVEQARRLARASGGAFRLVRDDAIDDHGAPQRADAEARRAFWAALDRLIAEAA